MSYNNSTKEELVAALIALQKQYSDLKIRYEKDISDLKKAEESLKKSQMLLTAGIESQQDTFFYSIDRNFNYLFFNKTHAGLMKFMENKDIAVGMNFLECLQSATERKMASENYERVFRGESFAEVRAYGTDGPVYYEGFFNPIFNGDNEIIGAATLGRNITPRKKTELELVESERKYKALFENMEEGFSLHEIIADDRGQPCDFRFLGVNKAYERHTGIKAADCIGKTMLELMPNADLRQIENYGKVALTGEPLEFDYFSNTFHRHLRVKAYCPHPGQFATIFEDITERKKAEASLMESEANLNAMFDITDESIFLVGKDETLLGLNRIAAKHLGYAREEVIGRKLPNILPPDVEASRRPFIDYAFRSGVKVSFEDERDGHWMINHLYPIANEKGEVIRLVIYSRDISERKHREEEIKKMNDELRHVNAEKDKFFSILAHDLRNPFNSLLGFTQMMEDELSVLSPDQVRLIAGSMRKSATNLYRLLENLLEWSRLQRGVIPFLPVSFVLRPAIARHMELAEEAALKKGILIDYDIHEDLKVFADENMLGGIIRNVASNAVKFTPQGGKVLIAARLVDRGWVEISVSDTGIGMSKQITGNIFRLDTETGRKGTDGEPSTGLGLIICKEFVEKHDGRLWIESEEGKGSTVYFTLKG